MERNRLIDFLVKKGEIVYLEKNEQGNMYISYMYLSDGELRLSETYGIDKKDLEENLRYCLAENLGKDKGEVSLIDVLNLGSEEFKDIRESTLLNLESEIKTSISEEDDKAFKHFVSNKLKDVDLEKLPIRGYCGTVLSFFFGDKNEILFVPIF